MTFATIFIGLLNGGVTGKIAGIVIDKKTNLPLEGVNVQIVGTDLGAASSDDGQFIILNIPPGNYTVRASYIGYKTAIYKDINVSIDLTTRLEISLTPTVLEGEEMVVTANRPMVQKDITSSISTMNKEEIESLPINNFSEALSLQAGVVGEGRNLNIRGGRSNEVAYLVDGMLVQDPLLGGLATGISNDAIQEMTLLSGTFNAEYGNALSGVVNIVTREGGEKLHGKIEGRTTQFGVDAYKKFEENRISGNLSGPLYFPWLRFFLSDEYSTKGSYLPFGYQDNFSSLNKLTLTSIPGVKLNILYRLSDSKNQYYSHSWKYIPDRYYRSRSTSHQAGLTMTHTLRSNLFYDMRISYFTQEYYRGCGKDTSEYMAWNEAEYDPNSGNGHEFYSNADPPELVDSETRTLEGRLDFVWQINPHNEVKFGTQYKQHNLKLFEIYDPKRDNPYIDDYNTSPFEFAGYIQDKIEFPYLVINLGLRYDYLNANARFRSNPLDSTSLIKVNPRVQISPRIGIAHPISDRTKLHFSYGHFFQNPEFQHLYENRQYDLSVREPIFGQANLDVKRTVAYEIGLSHQFTEEIATTITAYYKDITGLIGTSYYPAFADDAPNRYVGYTLIVNEDYANVKGFEVNIDARASEHFGGGLTYTFSVAKGSASSEMEQYPGTEESTRLYYLDFDKPHVVSATASFWLNEGEGFKILGSYILQRTDYHFIFRAGSGYPYTPSGRDVGFVEKNSLRRPSTWSLDVEFGKKVKFGKHFTTRIFAEILNLTNHRNILYVYPDSGDPDYTIVGDHSKEYMEDPSNYGPPRKIRLGLGIRL